MRGGVQGRLPALRLRAGAGGGSAPAPTALCTCPTSAHAGLQQRGGDRRRHGARIPRQAAARRAVPDLQGAHRHARARASARACKSIVGLHLAACVALLPGVVRQHGSQGCARQCRADAARSPHGLPGPGARAVCSSARMSVPINERSTRMRSCSCTSPCRSSATPRARSGRCAPASASRTPTAPWRRWWTRAWCATWACPTSAQPCSTTSCATRATSPCATRSSSMCVPAALRLSVRLPTRAGVRSRTCSSPRCWRG